MQGSVSPEDLFTTRETEVIGVVPAAGKAKRIAPLPCSKDLYPIGLSRKGEKGELRAKVVSEYLFDKFRNAHIKKAILLIRDGKWDIPAYFGDGKIVDMDLAYMVIRESCGPPETIDRPYLFEAICSAAQALTAHGLLQERKALPLTTSDDGHGSASRPEHAVVRNNGV